jgi:hypothetical protein
MLKERKKLKRFSKIISLFILLSLILPVGVFAREKGLFEQPKQLKAPSVQAVKVISLTPTASVVPQANNRQSSTSCSLSSNLPSNLLQNAGAINLNQPASCFTLAHAQLTAVAKLFVVAPPALAAIVVVAHDYIFQTPTLAPQPMATTSSLPIAIFVALVIFVFEDNKFFKKIGIIASESFKKSLTVYELQVIRC